MSVNASLPEQASIALDLDQVADKFAYGNHIAQTYLWPVMPPLFLATGTVTNILSIVIFTRPEMRKFSSFVYFAFLNIVNLGALYVNCFRGIMDFSFSIDIRSTNLIVCKSHVFLTYFLSHLSSLILSTISVDRVISVMFLRFAKSWCTPRVAIRVTMGLCAITFLLSSHFLILESGHIITTTMDNNNVTADMSTVMCDTRANTPYSYFVQNIWKLVDMSMYAFIPFTIMLTSSIIIIVRIAQQAKKMANHEHKSASTKQESRFSARTRNMAVMLLPVNVMFLIFVGPVVIAIYMYKHLGEDHLALFTVEVLALCNFTLNFFIYFLTSSKFREEFYKLVDEVKKKFHSLKERDEFSKAASTTTFNGERKQAHSNRRKPADGNVQETIALNEK